MSRRSLLESANAMPRESACLGGISLGSKGNELPASVRHSEHSTPPQQLHLRMEPRYALLRRQRCRFPKLHLDLIFETFPCARNSVRDSVARGQLPSEFANAKRALLGLLKFSACSNFQPAQFPVLKPDDTPISSNHHPCTVLLTKRIIPLGHQNTAVSLHKTMSDATFGLAFLRSWNDSMQTPIRSTFHGIKSLQRTRKRHF